MAIIESLTTIRELRESLLTVEDFLACFSLKLSDLSNVPEELRPCSLIRPGKIFLFDDESLAGFTGYIAEDRIDNDTTVVVGKEGQPFDTEELITPKRKFSVQNLAGAGLRFIEWRGKKLP